MIYKFGQCIIPCWNISPREFNAKELY